MRNSPGWGRYQRSKGSDELRTVEIQAQKISAVPTFSPIFGAGAKKIAEKKVDSKARLRLSALIRGY